MTLQLAAADSKFDRDRLSVPAGLPFAIRFDNRDAVPHNVSIRGNGVVQITEIFGGPAERTYTYTGLPAGSYTFICDVHPDMQGVLEATAGSAAR